MYNPNKNTNFAIVNTKSGVHLSPCEFTLSISKQYAKFLKALLNGELYKCDDTQYPEDTSYLVDVRSNGDGTYKYIVQFYNGGTWLNEVLEEGLNNLKQQKLM